jgi:phosphoribosyl-ATP pyrophosphohydrolase
MNIFELPDDIIDLIKEFIPRQKLVFVNKSFYNLYHHFIKKTISLYDNYVRDTIRRDNEFVFQKILEENIDLWLKNKQYRYKNMVFTNYIYFIMHYCIENNAENCREITHDYLKKRDLCRNLHKKNVVKYIKWNN